MLKKTIQYTNYNDEEVSEDFYFNFTKLEAMEMLEVEDLEAKIDALTKSEDAREAYLFFKELILKSYGEKSLDGKRFIKSSELTEAFTQSPACDELIIELLQDAKQGALFIEGTLPAKLVAEAKAAQAASPSDAEVKSLVETAAERQENPETAVLPTAPPVLEQDEEKTFDDYSRVDLLAMPQEKFEKLLPSKQSDWTKDQLLVAMQRKNK
jgi:hypothetical protein